LLEVEQVSAGYGEAQVLQDVSLRVGDGEVVTLVGRNGAGKTTLLRTVMGLHRQYTGSLTLDWTRLDGLPDHRRSRLGLGWVPDDRGVYATLTVEEHLTMPPRVHPAAWSMEQVYATFPVLADRRRSFGTQLSGGEQQMLALARVLRMGARVLLCDEPTEGLSPQLVHRVGDVLRAVKESGVAVLLVEQNVHFASTVADRHHLLAEGRVVEVIDNAAVRGRERELLEYLGI
jgi:branched-chain amino acid transport system ATP-binding protein